MTEIAKVYNDARQASKWRKQANAAAAQLKSIDLDALAPGKDKFKFGFAFDDGVATVELDKSYIRMATPQHLADTIYQTVAKAFQPAPAGLQPDGTQ